VAAGDEGAAVLGGLHESHGRVGVLVEMTALT
jgi:hypothetical protein